MVKFNNKCKSKIKINRIRKTNGWLDSVGNPYLLSYCFKDLFVI